MSGRDWVGWKSLGGAMPRAHKCFFIYVNYTAVNIFKYLRGINVLKTSHSAVPVLFCAVPSQDTQSYPGLMPDMSSGGSQKHSLSH